MKLDDCKVTDEIVEHIDDKTGERRFFNATQLGDFAYRPENKNKSDWLWAAIEPEFVQFVVVERGVDLDHVASLSPEALEVPILSVHMPDGTTLMVDGHHRLVRLFQEGRKKYRMVRVKLGEWEPFVLDLPPELADELSDFVEPLIEREVKT